MGNVEDKYEFRLSALELPPRVQQKRPSERGQWYSRGVSPKFLSVCMYVWRYCTIPPNLNPPIMLKTSFGAKPPNLMTANISGYTVPPLL